MLPDFRNATEADLIAAYQAHAGTLRALAEELNVPPSVADELIDEALVALLFQRLSVNAGQWLAARFRALAEQYTERYTEHAP